jgi:hypothetical protein
MNVQMRIITDKNIDQLMSMSYSDNIIELTKNNPDAAIDLNVAKDLDAISSYAKSYANNLNRTFTRRPFEQGKKEYEEQTKDDYKMQGLDDTPDSPAFVPNSPEYAPESPAYNPESPVPALGQNEDQKAPAQDFGSAELNEFFDSLPLKSKSTILGLPERDQRTFLRMLKKTTDDKKLNKEKNAAPEEKTEILDVVKETGVNVEKSGGDGSGGDGSGGDGNIDASTSESDSSLSKSGGGETKSIVFNADNASK